MAMVPTQVRPAHKHLSEALGTSMTQCAPLLSWLFMLHSLNKQLGRVSLTEFHNPTASSVPDTILYVQCCVLRGLCCLQLTHARRLVLVAARVPVHSSTTSGNNVARESPKPGPVWHSACASTPSSSTQTPNVASFAWKPWHSSVPVRCVVFLYVGRGVLVHCGFTPLTVWVGSVRVNSWACCSRHRLRS